MALADTAATHHFLDQQAMQHCADVIPASGPTVIVANGGTIVPHSQCTLPLSTTLSSQAKHGYVFDDLRTGSLISLDQLCDDECIRIFSKYKLRILKDNKIIIEERRTDNGLWEIPIATPP